MNNYDNATSYECDCGRADQQKVKLEEEIIYD